MSLCCSMGVAKSVTRRGYPLRKLKFMSPLTDVLL